MCLDFKKGLRMYFANKRLHWDRKSLFLTLQMEQGRIFTAAARPTWRSSPAGGIRSRIRTTSPTRSSTPQSETWVKHTFQIYQICVVSVECQWDDERWSCRPTVGALLESVPITWAAASTAASSMPNTLRSGRCTAWTWRRTRAPDPSPPTDTAWMWLI